ncbi:MAG: hypothetical protein M1561_01990 [Gammaproteobacteria bacterium]|nr:hypothetical protein [Gammaproteobacteria bacterium]
MYSTKNGKAPFIEWLESLNDKTIRYRIKERLDRIALGNFILLLCGGNKSSQKNDIKKAKKYLHDYLF